MLRRPRKWSCSWPAGCADVRVHRRVHYTALLLRRHHIEAAAAVDTADGIGLAPAEGGDGDIAADGGAAEPMLTPSPMYAVVVEALVEVMVMPLTLSPPPKPTVTVALAAALIASARTRTLPARSMVTPSPMNDLTPLAEPRLAVAFSQLTVTPSPPPPALVAVAICEPVAITSTAPVADTFVVDAPVLVPIQLSTAELMVAFASPPMPPISAIVIASSVAVAVSVPRPPPRANRW